MRLQSLRLSDFRAHTRTEITLAPKVNLLHGANGAGKTNVLEAIHCLCLSKSFLTTTDANVLRRGADFYEVEGTFSGDRRPELKSKVVYTTASGKRIFLNSAPLDRLVDIVGEFPVVVLSPADHQLTAGGPEERRRFMDATLSQAHPVYLDDLLKYRRVLKQRNSLLFQGKRGGWIDAGTLRAWTQELVAIGSRIIYRRKKFLDEFASFLEESYGLLESVGAKPTMEYVSVHDLDGITRVDEIEGRFAGALDRLERSERQKGRTLKGPHRDEIVFRLGEFEVRPYASQGQHRTVGLALRLATALFLNDQLEEMPLLLLDDVFGALDSTRAKIVLDLLASDAVGQCIVTAARPEALSPYINLDVEEHQAFEVVGGAVVEALLSHT